MFLGPQVVYGAPYSLHDRTTAARNWEIPKIYGFHWLGQTRAQPGIGRICEIGWLPGFYWGVVRDFEVLPGSSVYRNPAKLTNNDVSGPASRVWSTLFAPRPHNGRSKLGNTQNLYVFRIHRVGESDRIWTGFSPENVEIFGCLSSNESISEPKKSWMIKRLLWVSNCNSYFTFSTFLEL